jgi:hypothetical protein
MLKVMGASCVVDLDSRYSVAVALCPRRLKTARYLPLEDGVRVVSCYSGGDGFLPTSKVMKRMAGLMSFE